MVAFPVLGLPVVDGVMLDAIFVVADPGNNDEPTPVGDPGNSDESTLVADPGNNDGSTLFVQS
jgi:hypothetical protein